MTMTTPIYKRLVEVTRDGPVESWLSRIAEVVERAGLDPANIPWNGSPKNSAYEAQEYAQCLGRLDELEGVVSDEEDKSSLRQGKGYPPR